MERNTHMKLKEAEQNKQEYLKQFTCRGCYNHCSLDNPGCGRSKIWINEALEKYEEGNTLHE